MTPACGTTAVLAVAAALLAVPAAGPARAAPTRPAAPAAPAAPRTVPGDTASVLSARTYRLPGQTGLHVVGEVRNDGNETVAIVPRAVFRAADGDQVDSVLGTYTSGAVTELAVRPGATAVYDLATTAPAATAAAVTVADASPYLAPPPRGSDGHTGYAPQSTALSTAVTGVAVAADGTPTVSGTVTNTSPRGLDDVTVQVVDRDADGPVRAVVVEVGALRAGGTATWTRPGTPGGPVSSGATAVATGFERADRRSALTLQFDPDAYDAGRLVVRLTLREAPGTGVPTRAIPGAVLTVTRRGLTGPEVPVTRARTDARGNAVATLPLVGGSFYSFAYAGDAAHAPALFPDSTVGVPPTVTVLPPARVRAQQPVVLTVKVVGGQTGDRVSLRRRDSGRDTTLSAVRLGSGGLARVRLVLPRAGRVVLLAAVDGSTAHPGAVGRTVVVSVTA